MNMLLINILQNTYIYLHTSVFTCVLSYNYYLRGYRAWLLFK
jgi:hypothetical protein